MTFMARPPNGNIRDLARRAFHAQAGCMMDLGTLHAAWACPQCRRYRRLALLLTATAVCALILL
jgi:hypothetical protein